MDRLINLWLLLALLFSSRPTEAQAPSLAVSLRDTYSINPVQFPRVHLCVFISRPPPTVTWTRNGEPLPTSAGSGGVYYEISNGTLVIDRAGSADNGEFECTGTNSQGQSTKASTRLEFVRPSNFPWYISWYMWFVYAIAIWAISILLFIAWFFYLKRKASHVQSGDDWIGN